MPGPLVDQLDPTWEAGSGYAVVQLRQDKNSEIRIFNFQFSIPIRSRLRARAPARCYRIPRGPFLRALPERLLAACGRGEAPSPASGRWQAIPCLGRWSLPPAVCQARHIDDEDIDNVGARHLRRTWCRGWVENSKFEIRIPKFGQMPGRYQHTTFGSVISASEKRIPSRPSPDFLTPPNGIESRR